MTQNNQTLVDEKHIPKGYKKTEVGVIPSDWDVKKLGDISSIYSGGTPNRKVGEYWGGLIPWVTTTLINGGEIKEAQEYITSKGYENSSAKWCEKETILMAMYGQGKTRGKVGKLVFGATINQACAAIKVDDKYNVNYILSFLNSKYEAIRDLSNAGGQENLSGNIVKSISILIPSLNEQQKIATALSDTDTLISELEKLIEKKRTIKTATMQQLLTGKTRLPEFALREDGTPKAYKDSELGQIPEDWEVIEFQNLLETTILKRKLDKNSEVTFISMQDVSEKAELKHQQTLAYENIKIGLTYFERNDTLVAKITPCFENGKGCFTDQLDTAVGFGSTEFHVLRSNSNTYPKFIYYWTLTEKFRKSLEKEMVGSAGHRRVPLKEIQKFKIQSSLNKDEQRLISRKISDAESELKVLEAKLEKNRKIKQGMMQELLTGKTRLV